ncbi:MAG TPA: ribonuclease HII [Candidatus Thermoplasmatota archaeon]|jgi:ribonuclease HII|nr:ribonuclease HII [Candidatus Thermoplasmatota archaeon]
MIAGVDEAGRGPVLGPLVVAGVAARSPAHLRKLGARDSKLLSAERRAEVAAAIRAYATCEVRVMDADELNRRMATRTLNEIEVAMFAGVLRALAPERAIVDACDVDEHRFGAHIARLLPQPAPPIVSRHGADASHAIVGAASVIAKVERDARIARIQAEIGEPIGSGYCHDPVTIEFLRRWRAERGGLPPHTRVYWSTVAGARPLDRRLGEDEPPGLEGPGGADRRTGAAGGEQGPAPASRGPRFRGP